MADYQVGNLKLASEFFNVFFPQSGPLNTILALPMMAARISGC